MLLLPVPSLNILTTPIKSERFLQLHQQVVVVCCCWQFLWLQLSPISWGYTSFLCTMPYKFLKHGFSTFRVFPFNSCPSNTTPNIKLFHLNYLTSLAVQSTHKLHEFVPFLWQKLVDFQQRLFYLIFLDFHVSWVGVFAFLVWLALPHHYWVKISKKCDLYWFEISKN